MARGKCWMVEDSFSRLSLVARCSPENQRFAVEWLGALVYTHAETQVRNSGCKENPGPSGSDHRRASAVYADCVWDNFWLR